MGPYGGPHGGPTGGPIGTSPAHLIQLLPALFPAYLIHFGPPRGDHLKMNLNLNLGGEWRGPDSVGDGGGMGHANGCTQTGARRRAHADGRAQTSARSQAHAAVRTQKAGPTMMGGPLLTLGVCRGLGAEGLNPRASSLGSKA